MNNLTEKERERNRINSEIRQARSDIQDLESDIYELMIELEELEDSDEVDNG